MKLIKWINDNSEMIITFVNILIAITNIIWAIIVYQKSTRSNNLKTLVLDYNISKFYDFFSNIEQETILLKSKDISLEEKKTINQNILLFQKEFEQKFSDLFLAVDKTIYDKIKKASDDLYDSVTNAIFDEGINLYNEAKYDEYISSNIGKQKTAILKILIERCK